MWTCRGARCGRRLSLSVSCCKHHSLRHLELLQRRPQRPRKGSSSPDEYVSRTIRSISLGSRGYRALPWDSHHDATPSSLLPVELCADLLGRLAHVGRALDGAALEVGRRLLGLGREVARGVLVCGLLRLAGDLREEGDGVSAPEGWREREERGARTELTVSLTDSVTVSTCSMPVRCERKRARHRDKRGRVGGGGAGLVSVALDDGIAKRRERERAAPTPTHPS